MARISRAASVTVIMLNAFVRPVPAFLVRSSLGRATCFSSSSTSTSTSRGVLLAGKGFGQAPKKPAEKPPQEPAKDQAAPKKARSLMPMADEAASKLKLLAKEGADGTVKFDNPAVGDFQVLDALVEYPGSFDLKIIGVDDDTFVSDIRKAVAGCLTNGEDNVIKCSTREKGKYTSITLKVHVQNSTQLYKCYEVINQDKRVKFKF